MARSILPCKNRKTARAYKARVSRRHRRRERQALHELVEDDLELAVDVIQRERRVDMSRVVWDRQAGDKVNPFIRWAKARTRGAKNDLEAHFQIKSLIGSDSVIKEHALGHFVWLERAQNPTAYGPPRPYRRRRRPPPRPFRSEKHVRKLLRKAIQVAHKELNAVLKQVGVPMCDRESACRKERHASECPRKLLLRSEGDVLCIANRIWHHGQRPLDEPPTLDERLALFLVGLELLRS